jgi:hypothetical protein
MPFYLEYTVHRTTDARSAVEGSTLDTALESSTPVLKESACRRATLRWTDESSTTFGEGDVVATYTDTAGWEKL